MVLWNSVTLETDASSLNDKVRVKEIAMSFLPKYADLLNRELKTKPVDRMQLWLAHLLGLYQAALLSS